MSSSPHRYFILNKPYNMVSQFVSTHAVNLLGDIGFNFPEGIHAIGRLDNLSEGLLILTTNKKITRLLFEAATPHKRTYLVLVNHAVTEERLQQLREGVKFRIRGGEYYTSAPCEADIVLQPEISFPSPYTMTKNIPYTWLRITLTEGKFHQVRKMVAAIHHRCKRLIRVSIEDLTLGDLEPGGIKEIDEKDFFMLLKINVR
ncbi:MAG: rRNA pseudouridine synthase [Chitinophagaceae bacterium]|nr:rRNA pseudouridine synthase [Chitinophagaceae bacterium]